VRILVVGATGPLGRALVPRLVESRHVVQEPAGADLRAHDLRALVRGCDAVVAGAVSPATTRRLLHAAVGCGVRRYVQQSFAAIYRDGGDSWLDEDAPIEAAERRSDPCRSVIETEAAIRQVDPQTLGWTILRGGPFVGSGTRQEALIDRLRSRRAVIEGDGSNYLSPVNVADMAAAVAAALRSAPAGSTFNVVDEPLRYSDYVDALADLIGVERPPRAAVRRRRESRRCTNAAARAALGWMPRHSIWPSRVDLLAVPRR